MAKKKQRNTLRVQPGKQRANKALFEGVEQDSFDEDQVLYEALYSLYKKHMDVFGMEPDRIADVYIADVASEMTGVSYEESMEKYRSYEGRLYRQYLEENE